MPTPFASVTAVAAGARHHSLPSLLSTAPWWVVFVRAKEDPIGCVYGGRSAVIPNWVHGYEKDFGPATDVVAYPFDTPAASVMARPAIDEHHFDHYLAAARAAG